MEIRVVREVVEKADQIILKFHTEGVYHLYSFKGLIAHVSEVYSAPYEPLLKFAEEIGRVLGFPDLGEKMEFRIDKKDADANGLKEQIIVIIGRMEYFIAQLIKKAEEIRERQDLEGWIWLRAEYCPERGRFIPSQP